MIIISLIKIISLNLLYSIVLITILSDILCLDYVWIIIYLFIEIFFIRSNVLGGGESVEQFPIEKLINYPNVEL